MCYVGKATKIFIFLITVLLITSLFFVFGILRRTVHPKSHQCSGESCYQSDIYPPPSPPPFPEFPIASAPDLTFTPPLPPSLSPSRPPPPSTGTSSNPSPPPPAAASLASPPPPESSVNQTPPPPVRVVTTAPPPPAVVLVAPPPPVVVVAPPPVLNSPSQVPVTPGPVNSS